MQVIKFQDFEEVLEGLPQLLPQLPDVRVLGVGESTHGTHEFFENKAVLFDHLVKNYDYRYLAIEDRPESVRPLDQYIHGQLADVDDAMSRLYRVWQVAEVRKLLQRLSQLVKDGLNISIVGIDIDQERTKPEKRDEHMADNVLKLAKTEKIFVWSHNAHVRKSRLQGEYARPMGYFLSNRLEQQYCAIGQFFNQGTFSAGIMHLDNPDLDSRKLKTHRITPAPAGFIEHVLSREFTRAIMRTDRYKDSLRSRSFGWGIVQQQLSSPDMHFDKTVLAEDFDAVIFIDQARATRPAS